MALQRDHEFAPAEIARATFPTAFRGYDQDAVRHYLARLATALEHRGAFADLGELGAVALDDRVDELEAEIATLQDEIRDLETELVQRSVDEADHDTRRASEVEFDEHRAIELLGQETARVLESARSAAADILKRSENQASTLKSEAKRELADARRQAKQLVADKRAEAEEAIDQLTEEAERAAAEVAEEAEEHRRAVLAESAKILADSEADAQAAEADAEVRARQIVADAEALRQQVITELVADRRSAQADLDRLTDARDRLALSLAVARSELDDLSDALAEASGAAPRADDGSEGVSVEVDGDEVARVIEHLDADLEDSPAADSTGPASGRDGSRRPEAADEPTVEMPAVGEVDEPDGGLDELDGDLDDDLLLEADADDGPSDPGPVADEESPAGVFDQDDPESSAPVEAEDEPVVDLREPEPDHDVDVDVVPASADVLNVPPSDGGPLSLVEGFNTIVLDDDERPADAAADRDRPPARVLLDADADPATIITAVAGRAVGGAPHRTQGDLLLDDADQPAEVAEHFAARDLALTRFGPNLRRQLRRALNDDQSEVLDRLRSGRGRITADELMSVDEQIQHYEAPLRHGVTDLVRAGARAGDRRSPEPSSVDNLIDQLAGYIVERVRVPTEQAIEEADHSDRERILEPVRSLYRDFRNIGLPTLVEDALHEAFAIGLYDSHRRRCTRGPVGGRSRGPTPIRSATINQ